MIPEKLRLLIFFWASAQSSEEYNMAQFSKSRVRTEIFQTAPVGTSSCKTRIMALNEHEALTKIYKQHKTWMDCNSALKMYKVHTILDRATWDIVPQMQYAMHCCRNICYSVCKNLSLQHTEVFDFLPAKEKIRPAKNFLSLTKTS